MGHTILCVMSGESLLSVFLILAVAISKILRGAKKSLGEAKPLFAPLKYTYDCTSLCNDNVVSLHLYTHHCVNHQFIIEIQPCSQVPSGIVYNKMKYNSVKLYGFNKICYLSDIQSILSLNDDILVTMAMLKGTKQQTQA